MRVLIVGCGYVGTEVGRLLAADGHQVVGLRRTPAEEPPAAPAGVHLLTGDITQPAELASLPGPFDWLINTVSSSRGGLAEYRQAYLGGTWNLITWLAGMKPRKYIYTSSTSVYGQTDGSFVDETSPATPDSPTGQVLIETERMLLEQARGGFPAVILRVAGIYGPGRGYLFQQYLRGQARITGAGNRFLNMIHRDDVAGAIVRGLDQGRPGQIYNVSDNEPVSELAFFQWLAEQLGRPLPPKADPAYRSARKRGLTNKRVSNEKLRQQLGYSLKYPSFREGYQQEIQGLKQRD